MNKEPGKQSEGRERPPDDPNQRKTQRQADPAAPSPLSERKNKFDFDKILNSIKSMLGAEGSSIQVDVNDDLGNKIVQIKQLTRELSQSHLRLSKDFVKIDHLLAEVFKDIEDLRGQRQQEKEGE